MPVLKDRVRGGHAPLPQLTPPPWPQKHLPHWLVLSLPSASISPQGAGRPASPLGPLPGHVPLPLAADAAAMLSAPCSLPPARLTGGEACLHTLLRGAFLKVQSFVGSPLDH